MLQFEDNMAKLTNEEIFPLNPDIEFRTGDWEPYINGWDEHLAEEFILMLNLCNEMSEKITAHVKKHTEDPRNHCMLDVN